MRKLLLIVAVGCGSRTAAPKLVKVADPCQAITAADLAEVCGSDAPTLTADGNEGQPAAALCSRWLGSQVFAPFRWTLRQTEPATAVQFFDRAGAGPIIESKDVELGDRARIEHDHTAMESQNISLRVVRGGDIVELVMHQLDGKRATCSDAQLIELARRALERL